MNSNLKLKEKIQIHEKSIEELRRMHDEVKSAYSQVKIKIITFMGGGFAFLSFLYQDGDLFFPKELYGRIFYTLGLFSYLISLFILFLATQPISWELPTERKKHKELKFNSYLELLNYIKNEYVAALDNNITHHDKKQKKLNLASFLLIIGAILLIVIKNFK